jgi:hypothetical protein
MWQKAQCTISNPKAQLTLYIFLLSLSLFLFIYIYIYPFEMRISSLLEDEEVHVEELISHGQADPKYVM